MTDPRLAEGRARADTGIDQADANTDHWWRDCCDRAIAQLAAQGIVFQAVDLLDLGVPEPDHPNRWGARLREAARAGVIQPAGWGPSRRPTTACSAVRLWRGVTTDEQVA